MMVERKLDSTVDESLADWEIQKSDAIVHINCEKSGGLVLAEPSLSAGWLAGRQNLGEAWYFKILLQIAILDFPLCLAKHCFNNFDALLMLCYKAAL